MTALDQPAGVRRADPRTAARGTRDPAEVAAWRGRVELAAQVEAAAAALVESRMPAAAPPASPAGPLRVGVPVAAALAVVLVYVGLPLALAASAVLGALPNALVLAAALVVLATVAVLAVLRRTSTAVPSRRRTAPHRAAPHRAAPDRGVPDRGVPDRGVPDRGAYAGGVVPVPRTARVAAPARRRVDPVPVPRSAPAAHRPRRGPGAPGGPAHPAPAGRHRARSDHPRR